MCVIIENLEQVACAHCLTCIGLLVALGFPLLFMGVKLKNTSAILLGGPIAVVGFAFIQVVFVAYILTYTKSLNVISSWRQKADAKTSRDAKDFKLTVASLRPIFVRAGKFGIFDDEIRANYTEKLLGYCVDITIALNTIFN